MHAPYRDDAYNVLAVICSRM